MPTLNWIGKEKVINHHQDVPYRVLEHQYGFDAENGETEHSTKSGNKIIHGDNLEALKSLLPEYEGKVKCIYIDPPYNTGNESWVYNDNVNHPKIKKWLGEVVGKEGDDLSRHDKWLCMMYPRLKLLHKLLSENGVIFISIDDNEHSNLKLICDEIFGSNRFISTIAIVNNYKGRSDDKYIATAHESLLMYHKGNFVTKGVRLPEKYIDEYKLEDDYGKFRLQGLRKRGAGAKRKDRPNMYYPFFYNPKTKKLSLERKDDSDIEILPRLSDETDGRWRWGKSTSIERINELYVRKVRGRDEFDVFQKDYLKEKTIKPKSFWHGSEFSSEAGTLQLKKILGKRTFETPKSTDLIKYCLEQATHEEDIILDSFAGSGTTAHSVLSLNKEDGGNRKFILVEMEDYADSVTARRVKLVIKGYSNGKKITDGTGGSFDYFELGKSLFDEDGLLNEEIEESRIREYVWYSETNAAYSKEQAKSAHTHLLGSKNKTDYYFFYEKETITTLNHDFLATITQKADQYVIYADNCLLSIKFMRERNIIYKKIPRDITRF
ncbi:MAG: site-specific DNA-methyltransferase [Candidatus Paceibacterota bacterium]